MFRMSPREQFEDLRNISENVLDYLTRELYKETSGEENDYDINEILRDCYTILLEEIKDLGISFYISDDEILEDFYTAKHLYYLKLFLDKEYLKNHLTEEHVDYIETLLQDASEDELFMAIYEHLSQSMHNFEFNMLDYLIPYIANTDKFALYIKDVVNYIRNIDTYSEPPANITRMKQYIEKIMLLRKYATDTVHTILEKLPNEVWNKKKIDKLLRDYDKDKLTPEDIKIYSFVDLGNVNLSLESYKNKMMFIHHSRSPHHIEYWMSDNNKDIPFTKENALLLVAHHNEPDTSPADFWKEIDHLLEFGKRIFTSEQLMWMNKYAEAVYPRVTSGE